MGAHSATWAIGEHIAESVPLPVLTGRGCRQAGEGRRRRLRFGCGLIKRQSDGRQGHARQEGAAGTFTRCDGLWRQRPAETLRTLQYYGEGGSERSLEATPRTREHNRLRRMSELGASLAHFMATFSRTGMKLSLLTQGEFACVVIAYVAPLLLKSMARHKPAWSVIVKVVAGNAPRR